MLPLSFTIINQVNTPLNSHYSLLIIPPPQAMLQAKGIIPKPGTGDEEELNLKPVMSEGVIDLDSDGEPDEVRMRFRACYVRPNPNLLLHVRIQSPSAQRFNRSRYETASEPDSEPGSEPLYDLGDASSTLFTAEDEERDEDAMSTASDGVLAGTTFADDEEEGKPVRFFAGDEEETMEEDD